MERNIPPDREADPTKGHRPSSYSVRARSWAVSPLLGNRPTSFLSNSGFSPAVTRNRPPDEGMIVSLAIFSACASSSSSATRAA